MLDRIRSYQIVLDRNIIQYYLYTKWSVLKLVKLQKLDILRLRKN